MGVYRLGIHRLQLAYLTLEQNDLHRLAIPFMHHLCDLYEENIDLAVLDEAKALPSELPPEGSCGLFELWKQIPEGRTMHRKSRSALNQLCVLSIRLSEY